MSLAPVVPSCSAVAAATMVTAANECLVDCAIVHADAAEEAADVGPVRNAFNLLDIQGGVRIRGLQEHMAL